ncbi:hypothetical protein C0991_005835 [Blastosporella zonata]|nr:hypothetical protein C0991_005835 [Blastosporella zonata]
MAQAGLSKIAIERNQKILLDIISQPGNGKLSVSTIASKSITMDTWTKEQVESMKSIGNIKSNAIYNPNEVRNPPPPNLMDAERDSELEQYIRSKYQFKRFLHKSAFVASKLGPSRTILLANGGSSSRDPSTPIPSAVSSPPVSTSSPQIPARRQFTLSTAPPSLAAPPARTATAPTPISQYPRQPQAQPQTNGTPSTSRGGVWEDLVSLQGPSSTSSLPLQFQAPLQTPLNVHGYQTSMASGINPFQQQHIASNPYSQQSYSTSFQNPSFAPEARFSPAGTLNGSQQSYFANQQPLMSAPAMQAQNSNNFFQPQPQQALQVQNGAQGLFHSGNAQGGSFMSAPATQGHFLSTSPAQYPSHSPQPMLSMTPQPQMYSTTPQPHMFSTTPQPQQQPQMMTQFMLSPSQQFQMQQQGGLGLGSLQQGQTTMGTMGHQQPFFGGAGPPQPMGQFGGGF